MGLAVNTGAIVGERVRLDEVGEFVLVGTCRKVGRGVGTRVRGIGVGRGAVG